MEETSPSLTGSDHSTSSIPPPAQEGMLYRVDSGASVVFDPHLPPTGTTPGNGKLQSSRYKGVVPQPNGRWGAQIYEKHQRVWLGTFNGEEEAARSYDVAAHRFRGRDATTNFQPLNEQDATEAAELAFIRSRSKAEIVDMLRKHTYQEELQQHLRRISGSRSDVAGGSNLCLGVGNSETWKELLFDKAVTPSDVGKLNRLVISKHHAEKYFPLQIDRDYGDNKGVLLHLEDMYVDGKVWRFRYSYWNSSQSYVLTKGWSRFVKEKGLAAGDIISFFRSAGGSGPDTRLFIDCRRVADAGGQAVANEAYSGRYGASSAIRTRLPVQQSPAVKGVRLFGVNIDPEAGSSGDNHGIGHNPVGGGSSTGGIVDYYWERTRDQTEQ